MGCAPSPEILAEWNRRESELVAASTHLDRVVANLPEPHGVHAGSAEGDLKAKIGREGARTIPGRPEHGGNCDIKNLSRGSKTYLPVHVPGAKFSVGDLHFSQGDGEISFCGAIEMAGVITFKFGLMKGGIAELDMKSPIFLPGPVQPQFGPGRMLTFEGFSVDEQGKQHYMDATVAYRQTCLRVFEYLKRYGYSGEQIYLLLSCAPVEGHVAGIVDVRNDSFPLFLLLRQGLISEKCRFRTRARRWAYRWISLTLTSRRVRRRRSWTWAAARLRVIASDSGSDFD
jgi:formamidase